MGKNRKGTQKGKGKRVRLEKEEGSGRVIRLY